jgi:hypothetical protein
MKPLDVSTLGTIIGKLQNAVSSTAHGLHEDAAEYLCKALVMLDKERLCAMPQDPLVAAKGRLGVWLSAAPGRAWDYEDRPFGTDCHVVRLLDAQDFPNGEEFGVGTGPDLASAILVALDAANGGDRG